MLNSDHPGDPPLPFPEFNPLVINYHTAKIQLPEGTRTPFEIFSLFFSPELLTMMVTATNSHAAVHHVNTNHPWRPLCLPELFVWLDYVIYMGIHPKPSTEYYWRTEAKAEGPRHAVSKVMGSTRFHQIQRHLTLMDREASHADRLWYAPIEPLIYYLREAFKAYIVPGTNISIDEAIAKFKGCSRDITVLPGKPIPESFKVWLCAYQGYVYSFELHSREHSAERSSEPRPVIPQFL
jgi:hypothetical protein